MLDQSWHRSYDPQLGRYLQADPLGIEAGQNLYAYVDGRPLEAVDPDGRFVVAIPVVVGAVDAFAWTATTISAATVGWFGGKWIQSWNEEERGTCPVPIPDDPTHPPTPDFEWRGGDRGQWHNPKTGESLRPDLNHGPPIGPHWDYNDGEGGKWRVKPGGDMTKKNR